MTLALPASSSVVRSRPQRLTTFVCVAILAVVAVLFYAAHEGHPAMPTAGVVGNGWWGWLDQGRYLAAAQAFARLDAAPAAQHYEPGYPVLAAPFVRLTPIDPFLIPDLAALLLACWLFGGIGVRLLGPSPWARAGSMALFALASVGVPRIAATWAEPWTSTPTMPLLLGALLAALLFLERPRPWPCFLAALSSGAIAAIRPGDALVAAIPCAAAILWALTRRWPGRRPGTAIMAAGLLGIVCAIGPAVALHAAVWGLHPSPYMAHSRAIGFEFRLLPLRWVLIVVGPHPLTAGRGLAAAFPWMISGFAGIVACLAVPGREGRAPHLLLAGAAALSLILFLAYRDLHPAGIWRYDNLHYFKWLLPLTALYTLLLARALTAGERRAPVLLVGVGTAVALFCWRPSLRPVAPGAMPVTVAAPRRLTVANGLPRVTDAVLVAAEGGWADTYEGDYTAYSPGRTYQSVTDIMVYPRLGGFLLVPLRPVNRDTTIVFPKGVGLDSAIPPIPVRQSVSFAPPCWLVDCAEPDLLPGRPLAVGQPVAFGDDAEPYLDGGWGGSEGAGRWTLGGRARLMLRAEGLASGHGAVVTLVGHAYDPPGQEPAHVLLEANGHRVADWHISPGPDAALAARVPAGDLGLAGTLHLTLVIPHPRSPASYGQSLDPRQLGLFVRTIEIKLDDHPS